MVSLKSQVFWQLSTTFLNVVFPLITYPYVTRLLGPENIGVVNYIDSVIQFLIFIAALGIPKYGVIELIKKKNLQEQSNVLYELLIIHTICVLIAFACFYFLVKFQIIGKIPNNLLILGAINLLINPFLAEWFFHANLKYQILAKRNFLFKLMLLSSIFLFIKDRNDYILYYLFFTIIQVLNAFWNFIFYFERLPFKKISYQQLIKHIKPLFLLFAIMGCISLYVYFDTLILGYLKSYKEVGLYTSGVKIIRLILFFILTSLSVLFPIISAFVFSNDQNGINLIVNRAIKITLLFSIPIAIGLFIMAEPIMYVLSGTEFIESANVLKILCTLPMIIGLSTILGSNLMIPLGQGKKIFYVVFLSCTIGLPLQVYLTKIWSFIGTATATLIIEIIVLILCLLAVRNHIQYTFNRNFFIALLFITIMSTIFFYSISIIPIMPFYKLMWFLLIFLCIMILTTYLFKKTIWQELFNKGNDIPGLKFINKHGL